MAVTIKDIAKKAGVCVATVSKVINNSPTISEATSNRVKAIIKELNYTPSIQARSLSSHKSNNIVYFTLCKEHEAFTNPHMFEIMSGIKKRLEQDNYTLMYESVSNKDFVKSKVEKIINSRICDGIIIHGSATTKEVADYLSHFQFPYIFIGKPEFRSNVCWIDTNQLLSGEIAAEHLWERGYRKIAFIGGSKEEQFSTDRMRGACFTLQRYGFTIEENMIKHTDSSRKSSYAAAVSLINSDNRPDAIICESNSIVLSVIEAMSNYKLRIPEDIAIISFNDFPLSRLIQPSPTIVDINVFQMGVESANAIIRRIKHPELHIQSYATLPSLIVRSTT